MKIQDKEHAIQLRKQGYLYGQIAKTLHIAKSTAYLWVKDVPLTTAETANVAAAMTGARRRAVYGMAQAKARQAAALEEALMREATEIVSGADLSLNHQRILCATMFWCEGEKNVGSGIKFINSDPIMMRSFLTTLRSGFQVDESKFRGLLHLHEYHNEQEQIDFWSTATGIPCQQFYKSYIKPHTGKNMHEGYPGCLSLRYGDARLAKLLKMIYSSLGNNLGA